MMPQWGEKLYIQLISRSYDTVGISIRMLLHPNVNLQLREDECNTYLYIVKLFTIIITMHAQLRISPSSVYHILLHLQAISSTWACIVAGLRYVYDVELLLQYRLIGYQQCTHLYGGMHELRKIMNFCRDHKLQAMCIIHQVA